MDLSSKAGIKFRFDVGTLKVKSKRSVRLELLTLRLLIQLDVILFKYMLQFGKKSMFG